MISCATLWRDIYVAGIVAGRVSPSACADAGVARFLERFDNDTLFKTEYFEKKLSEVIND
jgi:hypothetical protein